jgi:hypothetical protein
LEKLGVDGKIMDLTKTGTKDVVWTYLPQCPAWPELVNTAVNLVSSSDISSTRIPFHAVTLLNYKF